MSLIGIFSGKNTKKKTLTKLKEIETLFEKEIIDVETFEQNLIQEFKEIEDLKKNLKIIIQQFKQAERLVIEKENIIKQLFIETTKGDKINLNVCNEYINMINHLDQKTHPILYSLMSQLSRLNINKTHEIYSKSSKNKTEMKRIDTIAKELYVDVDMFISKTRTHDTRLSEISKRLDKIRNERYDRKNTKKITGFKL